ncbi:ATP-dependent helicase hrq1-like [Phragmites australis]|uniref:ATP-dependent helicase hrq1-like n=1 Tax=Phragmites australis TaxID=29695 RepID=UPI002D79896F|nr:ATP-dependent helicase hrq1-like [Phragmites australis]
MLFSPRRSRAGRQSIKAPEVSATANSAWQDIMDDLSSIPTSPQFDAASKDFYSSSIPCSGRLVEDMPTCQGSSTGSSRKRRKNCKENGNGSPETLSYGANGTSEQCNIRKKSGVVKSAALSCHDMQLLEPAGMVEHLKQGLGKEGQMVHTEEVPSREASYVELPCHLSEAMREALKSIGISGLYSHQSQAIESSISGKHVVIATSTSSGKSLCYNIPVLESLSQDLMACALYIFPTKALAQDQLRTLLEMKNAFHINIDVKIYDGDTPREGRLWIRDNARLELANLNEVELIQNDGSPCGSKYFLSWNPPLHMTKEGSSKGSSVTRRSRYSDIHSPLPFYSYVTGTFSFHYNFTFTLGFDLCMGV